MMQYREQRPANTGAATTESDPTAELFNSTYVFGERTYAIEDAPGPAAPEAGGAPSTEEPLDLTLPAEQTPTPAAMGGPATANANEKWFAWPSGQSTLVVSLPNGADVRSLWFPIVPFAMQISPGQAPGNTMYRVTHTGAEQVPVPAGAASVAITAATQAAWSNVYVFASGEKHAGSKSGGTLLDNAPSSYDAVIVANPLLLNYWPLNDPAGTTSCADLGPVPNPMQALGDVALGTSGILYDNQTCAYGAAGAGDRLTPASNVHINRGPQTICLWVLVVAPNGAVLGTDGGFTIAVNAYNQLVVNANYASHTTDVIILPNVAHFFCMVIDVSVLYVYVDGVMVYTTSYIVAQEDNFALLGQVDNSFHLQAKIEKVANFSGAFNLSQIRQLYALGQTQV